MEYIDNRKKIIKMTRITSAGIIIYNFQNCLLKYQMYTFSMTKSPSVHRSVTATFESYIDVSEGLPSKSHQEYKDCLKQLRTRSHLTWQASLESTFQNFGKPFSHCPSQSWHFRQHDRKDVMFPAFQVVVTVHSTSSVIFTLLTISHLEPCHK